MKRVVKGFASAFAFVLLFFTFAYPQTDSSWIIGSWTGYFPGKEETRSLEITNVEKTGNETIAKANYGISGKKLDLILVTIDANDKKIAFKTPANTSITLNKVSNSRMDGVFRPEKGNETTIQFWKASPDERVTDKNYHRLVLLGDPHLPGKEIPAKENVIKAINSWDDVEGIIVLGDISFQFGTSDEYTYAKQFFGQLKKPVHIINGNHDYMYDEFLDSNGKFRKAYSGNQEKKLSLFKETFNLPEPYYTKKVGGYFLIFLSADNLSSYELGISQRQIDWLKTELDRNRKLPTLVFFHSPLKDTLKTYNKDVNTRYFVAQPEDAIRELIRHNPQIFLWISGHTHTPATNESYASEINIYEKQVTNIHNCDMNRGTIWTNSLYLYPDKVLVRTFDHQRGKEMDNLSRTIIPPSGMAK